VAIRGISHDDDGLLYAAIPQSQSEVSCPLRKFVGERLIAGTLINLSSRLFDHSCAEELTRVEGLPSVVGAGQQGLASRGTREA
jgi:hypothetical protein